MRGAWVQAPSIPSESTCGSFVSGLLRPSPAEAGYWRAFHPGRPGAPPSGNSCRPGCESRQAGATAPLGVRRRLSTGHRSEDTDVAHAEALTELHNLVAVNSNLAERDSPPGSFGFHVQVPPRLIAQRILLGKLAGPEPRSSDPAMPATGLLG